MKVGLRVDVDTFRGTKYGVPHLCRILRAHNIRASFFFSVGPDNMGRNLWRLLHPAFLKKMMRTKAASLYGWDILLRGAFWPGPIIGKELAKPIKAASDAGHEIGFHAWDHHAWQTRIDSMNSHDIFLSLNKGVELLAEITGQQPACSAVPAWKCNELTLLEKEKFPFKYNSDCRGTSIFYPEVGGKRLSQPQVPVTAPTYDEVVGAGGVNDDNYNECILSSFAPEKLNVLTIHAEVEGIARAEMFENFLKAAESRSLSFLPLGSMLAAASIGHSTIVPREIPGRDGWASFQAAPK